MKKQLLLVMLCAGMFCGTEAQGQETERLSGYVQAERFTKEKLNTMLFSTSVDPHWFQKGNNFWYEYKTSNGKAWYVVDPVAKTKRSLFDLDDIAAQKPGQFTRGIVVGEKEYLFLRTLILVGTVFFSILRRGDLESKSASVLSCFELLDG